MLDHLDSIFENILAMIIVLISRYLYRFMEISVRSHLSHDSVHLLLSDLFVVELIDVKLITRIFITAAFVAAFTTGTFNITVLNITFTLAIR